MKHNFVFMGNGDYRNKGCEAITRGTLEIFRQTFPESTFTDSYFLYDKTDTSSDFGSDVVTNPVTYPLRWSLRWALLQLALKLSPVLTGKLLLTEKDKVVASCSAVLSLGGDNYSLDYGVPKRFVAMGSFVKKRKKPLIIWGASIGPFSSNPEFEKVIMESFKRDADLIFVREEESYNYLVEHGLGNKVHLTADPAFMMQSEPCTYKQIGFQLPNSFIAVNFSPSMAACVTDGNMGSWQKICNETIDKLYSTYKMSIVLIPHVAVDKKFMEEALFDSMKKYPDIKMINSNLNSAQMKWVISQSKLIVAARTHATIAAFSTSVPTLSLGYSVKAIGLNKLLFGSTEYLLCGNEIRPESIMTKIALIMKNELEIKQILNQKNIEMRKKAIQASLLVKNIFFESD